MVKITEMPKYSSYVEPGAKWLGKVPAEWSITRLKFSSKINPPPRIEREKLSFNACFLPMESVHSSGQVEYSIQKTIKELRQGFTSFQRGDVIVAKITPCFENGKGAYLEVMPTEHGFGSTEFHVLRVGTGFNPKFIYYLTKTDLFMKLGERLMTGSAGQKRVQTEFVANFEFAHPSLACQSYIVDFLDKKTAQIDEAIAIKEQQIVLLKERKQIIIQKAVTQGLDPNVPMKDSGVDWIGQIPAHWSTIKIKHATHLIQTGPFGTQLHAHDYVDSGVPIINPKHMNQGNITPEDDCTVDEKTAIRLSKYKLADGDLILARRGELGRCAVISKNEEGWLCGTGSLILRPNKSIFDARFLYTTISGNLVSEILSLDSVGSTMDNLNTSILGNLPLPLPNINEQSKIINHIHELSINIDETASIQASQIEKLKEYKTTLINSAVTGKIKITPEMVEA